jgi:hypothetical protein
MAEQDNVVAGTGKCLRQSSRLLRVVLANRGIGPAGCDVVRKQPTVVGVIIDYQKLEQKP